MVLGAWWERRGMAIKVNQTQAVPAGARDAAPLQSLLLAAARMTFKIFFELNPEKARWRLDF